MGMTRKGHPEARGLANLLGAHEGPLLKKVESPLLKKIIIN